MEEYFEKLPIGAAFTVTKVLPGLYRVGFHSADYSYLPSIGSYYPLEEAFEKAFEVWKELHKDGD